MIYDCDIFVLEMRTVHGEPSYSEQEDDDTEGIANSDNEV